MRKTEIENYMRTTYPEITDFYMYKKGGWHIILVYLGHIIILNSSWYTLPSIKKRQLDIGFIHKKEAIDDRIRKRQSRQEIT